MKGQANIFGVVIGGSIMLLVVGMVLALTYMFIAQTDSVVGGLNTTISSTADVYTAVNGVSHALSHTNPTITAFGLSTLATTYDDALRRGNSSVNATNTTLITVSTPIDDGAVSGKVANITVISGNGIGANTSVYVNGVFKGYTNNSTQVWSITVASPLNITLIHNGANLSNVTNMTVNYYYFATNSSYTRNNNIITTTFNGTVRAAYTYASNGINTDSAVSALSDVTDAVDLFPQWLTMTVFGLIFVGLLGLIIGMVMFIRRGGLIGGGLQ